MHPRLSYLATPYTHEDPAVMVQRFELVNKVAGVLLERGISVFSPISHFHPIAMAHKLPTGWEFWKEVDTVYLGLSREMLILDIDGVKESTGVNAEIEISRKLGLPIRKVDPNDFSIGMPFIEEQGPHLTDRYTKSR